ncbi:MAG: multicopper oxidase domain-containing protein [Beijerinckiaceae bacterium]|nr:multicopper oxidase domain-containing protein [Beijerinckiaceae bacterium]MCI0736941.1 multicopper oxidase domain-containing protein [Beijerinckiaceae bacterium]
MPRGKISRRLLLGNTLASVMTYSARAAAPAPQDGFQILEAREGTLTLLPGPSPPTAIWGYNGEVPGPPLRFKKGEEVKVRLINKLSQPTTLHWHGVRIINAMDGAAGLTQAPVPPGGTFDYRFTPPDAGLYWYHPHVLPFTGEQLDRGLYGGMIIDEAEPPEAARDMLVLLDDWKLGGDGQIAGFDLAADGAGAGRAGPPITISARAAPVEETLPPSSRVRLRLVNAAHSRIMVIAFGGLTPLVLAIDSQPCEAFEPARNQIPLGPGARADVMFDLPADAGTGASVSLIGINEPDRVLIAFNTAGEKRSLLPPIASLPENPLLPARIKLEASRKIDILIEANLSEGKGLLPALAQDQPRLWKLNGKALPAYSAEPLFKVKRGTPVTLGLVNRSGFVQEIHVHGHTMRILHDLDDGWEPFWRDSVLITDGKTKHAAFVASNPGKWAIESVMAGRQAAGLATWFQVT